MFRFAVVILGLSSFYLTATASPAECFNLARLNQLFTTQPYEQTMTFCRGTGTAETIRCYEEAKLLFRVTPEHKAFLLCAGSPNTSPVKCYLDAYDQVSDVSAKSRHALQLCSRSR